MLTNPELKPCPCCGVEAMPMVQEATPGQPEQHWVECSNLIDCPVWPITPYFQTAKEAADAWQAGDITI
jgi:hypothetical protein